MDDGWRDKSAALQDATANSQLRKYSPFSGVSIPQCGVRSVEVLKINIPGLKELPPNASLTLSTGNFHEMGESVRR